MMAAASRRTARHSSPSPSPIHRTINDTDVLDPLVDAYNDQALPVPIQTFLWQQISPFTRPKLGKLHEASCMFCQHAPGHHELKEACKSFEKVLVQNIQFGLPPTLAEAVKSVPRWRLVQAAFPHVMHCAASLLHNRKDTNLQNLGAAETKLLYILHWIILDAAEECADSDYEKGIYHTSPFYYLFSIPSITLFVYLFAPLCHQIKESDLQTFRLENGIKIWQAMWEHRHPNSPCFTAHAKPKPRDVWAKIMKGSRPHFGDVFLGRSGLADLAGTSSDSPTVGSVMDFSSTIQSTKQQDEENIWVSSPKDIAFPETIPEESSSAEEDHMFQVIVQFTHSPGSNAQTSTSIKQVQVPVPRIGKIPTVTYEHLVAPSPPAMSVPTIVRQKTSIQSFGMASNREQSGGQKGADSVDSSAADVPAATFLDVAVLRCLFVSQWPEEGVFWALQFLYHRLQDLSEGSISQQQSRRRSNSLPIPKIEVSLYQSPETKKKENKDFIEVPEIKDMNILAEAPFTVQKSVEDKTSHTRRSSEKTKKKMKMADLRAFVETKLLSKSDKALEKIGQLETKSLDDQLVSKEYHRSLDTGDDNLTRVCSPLSKLLDPRRPVTNLVKGKSMPSLRYIGESQREQVEMSPNPIITVTEHTPTPSPDFLRRKGSIDSQLDAASLKIDQERKPSLTRSQTDSNITYTAEETPEASGSTLYITKDGNIDFQVVLKAVHSVVLRDNICCTLRVCEVVYNLLELLMDMGVLSESPSETSESESIKPKNKVETPHGLAMNCVIRVLRHLGCPHGCTEGQRGPPIDFLRSQGQSILSKLHRANAKQFGRYLRHMVNVDSIPDILDFFHSYVGFCVDPSSLLSPLNQKRSCSKSPDVGSQGGYATNFGAGLGGGGRGVEGQIMTNVFKALVTRLVKSNKDLKLPENMTLYCDVRQLMTYVKEAHGGVFRRVALSGLIDVAVRPHRKEPKSQTTRVIRHIPHSEQEDHLNGGSCYVLDDRDARKILFKKRSTSSTCASLLESDVCDETGKIIQSPLSNLRKKHHHVLTPRQSERNLGVTETPHSLPAQSRFQIGGLVNWFRREHGRSDSLDSHNGSDSPIEGGALVHQAAALHHSYSKSSQKSSGSVGNTLQRARRRMEDQFNKFGLGKGKKKDGSVEETQGSYLSRRNSVEMGDHGGDSEFVVLKERKLVPTLPVFNGMLRFSFLLETCPPGSLPDPHLLTALMDLPHAPVVAKAAFLFECCYFVHCCNKGQWPAWMKLNFPMFRPSGPIPNRGASTGQKRTHILQRAAGKMFYQWGEALGGRLEEMMAEDKQHIPTVINLLLDENKQKQLLIEDEEENFLDESCTNLYGSECPIALRLVACMLLMEITAFLRETYQSLPKLCRNSARDRPPPWERIYSREANRRWSMALSSMGHSQNSAQSLQSIAGDKDAGVGLDDGMSVHSLQVQVPSGNLLHLPNERYRTRSVLIPRMSPRPSAADAFNMRGSGSGEQLRTRSVLISQPSRRLSSMTALSDALSLRSLNAPSSPQLLQLPGRTRSVRSSVTGITAALSLRSLQGSSSLHVPGERVRTGSILIPCLSPRSSTAGLPSERKISFVLHEPDNESEGSSNTTVTLQGEEKEQQDDKKTRRTTPQGRPFLLRRGTATTTAPTTGSFKRRSLKLRRGTKEGAKDILDCDFKRADSIQSKRKVSSLSDRSDTSEQGIGEVSGEESPGILSDDQPPESPSDSNDADDTSTHLPWLKVMIQMANSFNYYCSHQSFCHPFCYKRHMRAATRLIKAVRQVYGEEFGIIGSQERRLFDDHKKDPKTRGHKESEKTSTQASPVRRKDSISKKDRIDKNFDTHKDSTKDINEDVEKAQEPIHSKKNQQKEEKKEHPPILKYLKTQVRDGFHSILGVLVKGAVVMSEEQFVEMLSVSWELLLQTNQEVAASAAALFILGAVRAPVHASQVMQHALHHQDPAVRINAILRFQALWKLRYQVWPRMEEGAHVTFKVPPPGIEFTLPSPKIGIESLPVVDPPWMPQVKTKVEEVTLNQESHVRHHQHTVSKFRSLVTATKTRKKQQTELIKMALQAREDKRRSERENFLVTAISITVQAAYEPSLHHGAGDDHDEGGDEEQGETQQRNTSHMIHSAHSLFPSCLCSSAIQIINLLDDAAVSADGNAVYEIAYQVIWNCMVEDSSLFLRYVLERLTREKQDLMFKILRHLIRFVPRLPQQAAFTLYNYIIGYVMFYVRSPHEEGQKLIGAALSVLWMVVHSVHGIMFKDLKQILRKEQCDASILLTANVPSTKKIIVHGPQEQDAGGIPSQFPVQEDTQFCQILRESLDFFGIDEARHKEFFLVDHKTHQIHNPTSYVRDFYFFKRSQYPQLKLVHMKADEAFNALQRQELMHKFVEIGKVLLTWAILKNVDMVVQRVVFLHEELMKLPSFPRKALEADLDLYKGGEMGKELLGLDVLHKFMWVRLIARMFEAMAGNFAYSGDIHLFLNVLNGAVILHSEDACILRYVMATYINAAHNFKNIFSTNGYFLIIPTLLQLYASHQTNKLVTRTVEYVVKQFYLMNRKPFILQMFGSVSAILDIDDTAQFGDAHKVPSSCLFSLLLSLETPSPDPLNIGELVKEEKPLQAIDFCYHDESEMVTVLDCISLCVMVVAYAADSLRAQQMLTILEAVLPCYLQQIRLPSYRRLQEGKTEREIISQLAIAIKTLVNNCEGLAKNYNGPNPSSPEHKGSSQKNYSRAPYSPGFDFEEDSHSKYLSDRSRTKMYHERDMEDSEVLRNDFRRPRDVLLSLVADFVTTCTARLVELNKKYPQDGKVVELLDLRSHSRLADVAHTLLKVSPYDPDTMSGKGLQRYITQLLPSTEWSNEALRPALILILRRIDKTFNKIYKKPGIRRHTDWEAAGGLLRGVYETLSRHPYIVHMQNLKQLVSTCQSLILGENSSPVGESQSSATNALMSQVPPPHFCSMVVRLIALQILAVGESYTLEQVCGGVSVFPSHEKTESMLMNLLLPLCLRVGSGRKDVHCMRQTDISFTLTVVLHAMCPPTSKSAALTIKSSSDTRTGSFTFLAREAKTSPTVSRSVYQVAFLGLKILLVCFENDLVKDWPRIARTIRDMSKVHEARLLYWNFIDFVVSQRSPVFVLLLPFINQKLSQPPLTEHERHLQFIIREKMSGLSTIAPKCRGALLIELMHEMKQLKEELDDRKYDEQSNQKKEVQQTEIVPPHPRHHRPSLIDLLTGANQSGNVTPGHRESISSAPGSDPAVALLMSKYASSTAGEIMSPGEESSSELGGSKSKPRLQRSKAQSRKTFRLRKSRIESHGHQQQQQQTTPPKQEEVSSPTKPETPQQPVASQPLPAQSPPPLHHSQPSQQRTVLKTEVSYEDDSALSQTSSTSGYRENCSLLLMAMESPPHPSTSSSTIVPPSPTSSSGDPSMLVPFETQDEDTLI
ncbi:uncharacterized protein LOC124360589 isoform X5 [Homalodisca vitripennis]|uniref:uncharacterized protein LOC124360589 isoform X5 n=1 Tax=Homalodisca vitripennis TaxID=197043 RepID=UPI001EEA0F28|nr:uncharacterized protein LOC124360589 isoform X5 [Homalodisca vitripennis]